MAEEIKDIMSKVAGDRRLLSHVPDEEGVRSNNDRRGENTDDILQKVQKNIIENEAGVRFQVDYPVDINLSGELLTASFTATAVDISSSGMQLKIKPKDEYKLKKDKAVELTFEITPGSMPEGYEMKIKNLKSKLIWKRKDAEGNVFCGFQFEETLAQYASRTKNKYTLAFACWTMTFVIFLIVMMRAESVLYFKFNKWLYLYSIVAATFLLAKYLFGSLYKPVPIDPSYTPAVTIIIPCFNEQTWIRRTILSCINQDYPPEQLHVIVVDDHSTDNSVQVIKDTIEELAVYEKRYNIRERLSYFVQPKNAGKRDAMAVGTKLSKHELLVFVDSDSFLNPFAIYNLVQPFKDAEMGGVCGRTDVANTYTNALTKMQAVRYYISFRIMKAAEGYFDAVTCLSGPLACYRKDLVLKYLDTWMNQKFLGQKATLGDDRSMTNFILKYNRTSYQDTAICSTIVPNSYDTFMKQQMRWKRSWLRESLRAASFMWKKEPFMNLQFLMGVLVPIVAPMIVLYNLIYVPIIHRVFPWTFILGMVLMSLMMSLSQKILRPSTTWIYGMWFCLYYEAVLLWQMPIAWFTFWKSTWGTRATAADVAEAKRKQEAKDLAKGLKKL